MRALSIRWLPAFWCSVLGRATRLLGYFTAHSKSYTATIRLGQSTVTDDAEGELVAQVEATDVSEEAISAAVTDLTGDISQVPASVSAIKVDGKRSYRRVREGEDVALQPRTVTVSRFEVLRIKRVESCVDVDVAVDCSSGTYVRALATRSRARARSRGPPHAVAAHGFGDVLPLTKR